MLLGFVQGVGHVFLMPRLAKTRYPYSPGALTAALQHVPIGITYIGALRAEGPIGRSNWMKSLGVLALFLAVGVAFPNVALADKDSPYKLPARQMGPYNIETQKKRRTRPPPSRKQTTEATFPRSFGGNGRCAGGRPRGAPAAHGDRDA